MTSSSDYDDDVTRHVTSCGGPETGEAAAGAASVAPLCRRCGAVVPLGPGDSDVIAAGIAPPSYEQSQQRATERLSRP